MCYACSRFSKSPNSRNLRSSQVTADATLAADLSGSDGDAEIAEDVDGDLDLAASGDALDGSLSQLVAGLPDLLALLLLLLVAVKIAVVVVGRLLLLGLGLGLGDLDVSATLDNLDEDIAASLGGSDVDGAAGRDGGLSLDDRAERLLAVSADGQDTNGVGNVLNGGNSGVGGLLNVVGVVLLDQRGLESGTASLQLGGVDGSGAGGGSKDGGGLGEDSCQVVGDAGSVRGTTAHDDLVNVENIEIGLLDGALDDAAEAVKDLASNHLVAEAVDGAREVEAVSQRLDAELGVGTQAESLLGSLGLEAELSERLGVLAGVLVVLLDELLGEVLHQGVVEVDTSKVVVVDGGQDGVHAAAGSNNGNVGAGATEVSDNNDLVLDLSLGAGIVGEDSGDGVRDELEDLDIGIVGGLDESLALLLVEVGRDRDDGRGNLLAEVVGGGTDKTTQEAGGSLTNGDGGGGLALGLVYDAEGDVTRSLLRVSRGVAVSRVDRLEAVDDVSFGGGL